MDLPKAIDVLNHSLLPEKLVTHDVSIKFLTSAGMLVKALLRVFSLFSYQLKKKIIKLVYQRTIHLLSSSFDVFFYSNYMREVYRMRQMGSTSGYDKLLSKQGFINTHTRNI